jgi:predicted nucleic acid-binding Zn ribbon protein
MATAVRQTHCDRCNAALAEDAAYCDRCGERTHRARRLVRLAIRVELLFVALVIVVVAAFAWIYSIQR